MGRMERIVLYAVAVALAIAVGILAWNGNGGPEGDCVGCAKKIAEELAPRFDAIEAALDGIGTKLDELGDEVPADVEARVKPLILDHGRETAAALKDLNDTVAGIEDSLSGLGGRVANAVCMKMAEGGCTATAKGECPQKPCPIATPCGEDECTPTERFSLLYEPARLNKNGEVTADSVGVKLAPRHRERLELLADALRACQDPGGGPPVEFDVTGYASTAEFRFEPERERMPNSNELKLKAANLRAQIVRDYLVSQGFRANTRRWSSAGAMERAYRDGAHRSARNEALSRTVLLDLKSAGTCDLGP